MKKIAFFFLSILILGCNPDIENSTDPEYAQYITGGSIDQEILFMPQEVYSTNEAQEPELKLSLISSENFPCFNYGIASSQFMKGDELIVRFDQIIKYDLCLMAFGPATSIIDLPPMIKKLTFINGNRIDQYSIDITEKSIAISSLKHEFTSSLYENTFRLPENSFAFVCGTNTDNGHIYTDFMALLEQNPAFTEFEFEGEGRIPYPVSSSGNWLNFPSRYFIYDDIEAFYDLATVLNDFTATNIEENSGVTISLNSWNNIHYYSWIDN